MTYNFEHFHKLQWIHLNNIINIPMDDQIYLVIYRCNFTRANLFCTSVSQLVYLQGQFVHSSVNKSATRPSYKINVMEKINLGYETNRC